MKYKITDNFIVYNGNKLYQIQSESYCNKYVSIGDLGGYIDKECVLSQYDESWINNNSYVYGNSLLSGKVIVQKDSIIENSTLLGNLIISKNVNIKESNISSEGQYLGIINANTIINNKNFILFNNIDNRITNSKYFEVLQKNGLYVIAADDYCKIGCLTMSYKDAWNAINFKNSIINEALSEMHPVILPLQFKNTQDWLRNCCKEQLNRKGIKIEEGN